MKITTFIFYLIASHFHKVFDVCSKAHARSIELNENMLSHPSKLDLLVVLGSSAELNSFLESEFLGKNNKAVKVITKDKAGYVITFENKSPLKMSPQSDKFLPLCLTSVCNIITMLRCVLYNNTFNIDYTYKEILLFDDEYHPLNKDKHSLSLIHISEPTRPY